MLRQSADDMKKSIFQSKNSRNSRSSTTFPSSNINLTTICDTDIAMVNVLDSGSISKIPCCIRNGPKSKLPRSEDRLPKMKKINGEQVSYIETDVLTANTPRQQELEENILQSNQRGKHMLPAVEDIFYRKISNLDNKSKHLDCTLCNTNPKIKLNTDTKQTNARRHSSAGGNKESTSREEVLNETKIPENTICKILKKHLQSKSLKDDRNIGKKENVEKAYPLQDLTSGKRIKKCRPTTAPFKQQAISEVIIVRKSASLVKYSENSFSSKIPILSKRLSVKKSETSPELNTDEVKRRSSKVNSCDGSRIPSRLRRKKRSLFKQENCSKKDSTTIESSVEITQSKKPGEVKNKVNIKSTKSISLDVSETIYINDMPNQTNLEDNNACGTNSDKRKFSSKIPVGMKTVAGISGVVNNNTKEARDVTLDKITKMQKNLHNKIVNYQVMAVPTIIYPDCPKWLNIRTRNKSIKNGRAMKNYEHIDKGKRLDRKESLENIPKRKIHLCCGDKLRSTSKLFVSKRPSLKFAPITRINKIGRKISKFRKYSNFKIWDLRHKNFNFKPNASAPNFSEMISEKRRKVNKSRNNNRIDTDKQSNGFQNTNSPVEKHEKIDAGFKIKCLSDTDLLHAENKYAIQKKKKLRKMLCNEKSIQTKIMTNDIEIQINLSDARDANSELQQVPLLNEFTTINNYCSALLETKANIEQVLKKCSSVSSIKSVDIGCQSKEFSLINSYSQTSQCTVNKSSQCRKKIQRKIPILNKPNKFNVCKSFVGTARSKLIHKQTKSSCNIRESLVNTKKTPGKIVLCLTVDTCAPGLDHKISPGKMSCLCKEVPLDQKGNIEEERQRNLYEDDDDEVEYSESYMYELVNTLNLENDAKICGSTPSLPEVVVATDRCESKLEIPWLKISLAPPGYYKIKEKEGCPRKVICDCWNLSANDDVYLEPVVQEQKEQPECKCQTATGDADKNEEKKEEIVGEEKENAQQEEFEQQEVIIGKVKEEEEEKPVIEEYDKKPPSMIVAEPETTTAFDQPEATESTQAQEAQESSTSAEQMPIEDIKAREDDNQIPPISEQPVVTEIIQAQELQKSTSSVDEKSMEAIKQEDAQQQPIEVIRQEDTIYSEEKVIQAERQEDSLNTNTASAQQETGQISKSDDVQSKPRETKLDDTKKLLTSYKRMFKGTGKGDREVVEDENEIVERQLEQYSTPEKEKTQSKKYLREMTICPSSSSSSSLPSDCICLAAKDECEDMLGRPTAFVYDNPCFGQHEGYMDPIYKLFPDDCDTYCGPHIEMPWSDLTIPRKIKLRQANKRTKPSFINSSKCPCKPEETVVCGDKKQAIQQTNQQLASIPNSHDNQVEKTDKSFEIQLSFTEIISNMAAVENKCAPSGVSVSIRPSSKERGSSTDPRGSNYSCKCASPKYKQNSPTGKTRSSKCKCASRDISFAKIESNTSHGSKCRNSNCKSSSPTKSSRRSVEQPKPAKKGYHDPVMNILETCEAEMEPLRDTLNQLKSKIRNLNIPELNNWNNNPMQCPPCSSSGVAPTSLSPPINRSSCMPGSPCMPPPPPPCMPPRPCLPPPQTFHSMQRPLQYPFPSMFSPMPRQHPPSSMLPRRCCPQCACKEIRPRRRSSKSASSSTEYSEYDSVSDDESGCPFLRALSSKNIYRDSKTQRKSKSREEKKKIDRQNKKSSNCVGKRYNKRSQAEYNRQDNYTDTEPEIQVHYGPKHPKMKTRQVFKGVVDKPSIGMAKNQRLRIAVKLTPSGQDIADDNFLAVHGPCGYK